MDRTVVHHRVDSELRDRLHEYARVQRRSVNSAVEVLLLKALRAEAEMSKEVMTDG